MSHNIESIAFLGSRNDVWHRLGTEMQAGMAVAEWAKAAGLDWRAIKVPAIANLVGPEFDHIEPGKRFAEVSDERFIARTDNGHILGHCSDRYHVVQPADVLSWFDEYISVDSRFQLDVAGSLKQGEIIWATATFNGELNVAGDAHVARLLMTTTYDGSGATINQGTMTRVVCNNTLNVALADRRSVVKTRHSTRFDAARVGKELATIAQSFDTYRAMGDAMAQSHISKEQVSNFFRACLDIPFDAKKDDVSTRKMNQFEELNQAYVSTCLEGTEPQTAWTALNAVTRYVDHERSTRGGSDRDESRFLSAQFGSGANMKEKAFGLLVSDFIDDKRVRELIPA